MKHNFQKTFQFWNSWPRNRQKIAQIEVFGHFLDFASLVFFDFPDNDRWTWCLVVFLQFAGPVNLFLLRTLDYHAPIKKNTLRANLNSFMSKALHKAIMMRSRMKNLYLKNETDLNWSNYKKQKNFSKNLRRKAEKEYFLKIDIIKRFFSTKVWIATKWCLVKTIK